MRKFLSVLGTLTMLFAAACTQEDVDKFLNDVMEVPATSIRFTEPTYMMTVGETLTLTVVVEPSNTTDKVEWSCLNEDVATVEDGVVTALKEGIASITAKAGDVQTGCRIVISKAQGGDGKIEATSIKLNKTEITLKPGLSEQLEVVEILPENANEKTVVWESSNEKVALVTPRDDVAADGTVLRGGKVTGRDPGEAIITARAGVAKAECKVTVSTDGSATIESITIDPSMVKISIDEEKILTAIITPADAKASIEWKSDNPKVVAVGSISDREAKIQGLSPGTTKVMAIAGGLMAYCEVTVEKGSGTTVPVESITLDKTEMSLTVGETAQLTATVLPENATDKTVTWSSTNDRVASVRDGGLVYATSAGQTVIEAKAGGLTASCVVTVTEQGGSSTLRSVSIDPSSLSLELDEEQIVTLVMDPADAEVTIYWESTSAVIANVRMISKTQAKVQGMSVGQATITVHAGDLTATCAVTVTEADPGIPVESVSLNASEITLKVNQQFQLVPTVLPENATNKEVVWSSSVPSSKLHISTTGMISALAECVSTITVRCKSNPQISATCKVTVTASGSGGGEEESEVVDLGLSVKWRSMNVGASKPEDYGNYYAWGETSTKSSYSWSNYKFGHSQNGSFTKYDTGVGTDNKSVLDPEDDAATVNLGGGWRTPTRKEWKELYEQCTWTWKTRNGVNGMQVTGPNGKSIFLPAGGWYDSTISNRGTYGSYWTASLAGIQGMASTLDFISSAVENTAAYARYQGKTVRPVMD